MSKRMNRNSLRIGLLSLAALTVFAAGASFTRAESPAAAPKTGETFVIGTDAPLASVASFPVWIESIDAVDTTTLVNTLLPRLTLLLLLLLAAVPSLTPALNWRTTM